MITRSPAPSVGQGVPRDRVRVPAPRTPEPEEGVDLDKLSDEWSDEPTMSKQIQNPELWKIASQEVQVFDLADAAQMQKYNELLTRTEQPTANLFIRASERQFCQTTSNWKVFVQLVTVKFRKIIKNKKPS